MEREIAVTRVVLAQLFSDYQNKKEASAEIQQLFSYPLTGAEQTQKKTPIICLLRLIVTISVTGKNRMSILKLIHNED